MCSNTLPRLSTSAHVCPDLPTLAPMSQLTPRGSVLRIAQCVAGVICRAPLPRVPGDTFPQSLLQHTHRVSRLDAPRCRVVPLRENGRAAESVTACNTIVCHARAAIQSNLCCVAGGGGGRLSVLQHSADIGPTVVGDVEPDTSDASESHIANLGASRCYEYNRSLLGVFATVPRSGTPRNYSQPMLCGNPKYRGRRVSEVPPWTHPRSLSRSPLRTPSPPSMCPWASRAQPRALVARRSPGPGPPQPRRTGSRR